MAYLVHHDMNDREILDYHFEGGEPVEMDLESDGQLIPRGMVLPRMKLSNCIQLSMRAPDAFKAAVPTRMIVKPKEDGYVPEFAPGAEYSDYLVSGSFRDLVERLEPSVHQFFPIREVVDASGRSLQKRFYLMNILSRLDAVIEELSDVHWVRVSDKSDARVLAMRRGLGRKPRLVLSRDAVEGHHVWLGARSKLPTSRFFSDLLHHELVRGNFSSLDYLKCEER